MDEDEHQFNHGIVNVKHTGMGQRRTTKVRGWMDGWTKGWMAVNK